MCRAVVPGKGRSVSDDFAPPERGRPAPVEPPRLGAALAEARAARGLSVEDVAAATRIRATLIRGIEVDDFSRCGGAAYARGHIRSIAQVVGADARELVAEFDRQHENPVPTLSASPLPAFEPPAGAGRPTARWASAAIAVLVIGVVFLAVSFVTGRGHRADESGGAAGPTNVAPSTPTGATSQPSGSGSASQTPTTSPPPPRGVSLRVRATDGASWLLVTASTGEQVYQGILAAGQAMDFKDGRGLTVKFGNSRAVTLTLNGRDLGAPRCSSIVCTREFPPNSASG
jgi:cytoskeleton protein RodZ